MIEEELFALEREAERRVREAGEREIDRGGPGSARRAFAAMDAPMLEVAAVRKTRQRFADLRMEIDHHKGVLLRTRRNPDLPPEVRRHREGQAETKLAGLEERYKALEAEAVARWPVGTDPAQLERRARGAEGLSGRELHRLRRDIAASPDVAAARKVQLDALADDANTGRLSPRETPRAEDATEEDRRAGLTPLLGARGEGQPSVQDGVPGRAGMAAIGAVALPEGGTLRPAIRAQASAIDLGDAAKTLGRVAPRAAAAAGAALGVLLTPWNSEAEFHYFGEDSDERLRMAPGDVQGVLERRDPRTGEWQETDEVGRFVFAEGRKGIWVVTGTPEQVDRAAGAAFTPVDPLPQEPGLVPPPVPGADEPESFPMEERGPTVLSTPAEKSAIPDLSGFSTLEDRPKVIEVFPDQSAELPQFIVSENRRGNPDTQDLNADVAGIGRDIADQDNLDVSHVGGGRTSKGVDVGETFLPNQDTPGGTKASNFLDVTFKSASTGRRLLVNTVDARAGGRPTSRERRAAVRVLYNKKTGDLLVLVPKPAPGEAIDRSKLREFLRPFLREIDRPHNAEDADAPSTIEWHLWGPAK